MENKLYNDNIINLGNTKYTTTGASHIDTSQIANKSLIQLEATLLDMASIPDLCAGVLYLFPVKVADKVIIRYPHNLSKI